MAGVRRKIIAKRATIHYVVNPPGDLVLRFFDVDDDNIIPHIVESNGGCRVVRDNEIISVHPGGLIIEHGRFTMKKVAKGAQFA